MSADMTILTDAARGVLMGYSTAYPQPLYLGYKSYLTILLRCPT